MMQQEIQEGGLFMTDSNRLLFIFNPHSGKEQLKSKLADILDIFAATGMEITVRPTQCAKDALETIKRDGEKFKLIVSSGGDGTLNESFNGLMSIPEEKRPIFGYIPSGTTNDFASTLHISKNPIIAANGIVNGEKFWCDVGKATTGYFAYVAAFGAFTSIPYETPQENKNALGHLAYILEGIRNLTNLDTYHMKVQYNNEQGEKIEVEDDFIYGMISNTRSVAGLSLGNESKIDLQDGLFEALLVKKPNNAIEMQQTINALLVKDFTAAPFYFFHTDAVSFSSTKDVSWTLDGEYGGTLDKMSIINIAKAIHLCYTPETRWNFFGLKDTE